MTFHVAYRWQTYDGQEGWGDDYVVIPGRGRLTRSRLEEIRTAVAAQNPQFGETVGETVGILLFNIIELPD